MENNIFGDWISLITDPVTALKSSIGTSIWIDGIEALQSLDSSSFFKPIEKLTQNEIKLMSLLQTAYDNSIPQENFWVSGHSCLMNNSTYYQAVNCKKNSGSNKYRFVDDEIGDFTPWNREITLGKKFFSEVDNQIRIPFYTFNHENTHAVFNKFYSNLNVSNNELYEIIVLIEWFCISTDLILAYDLIRKNQIYAFAEISRVPHKKEENNVFKKICTSIRSIDIFAENLKKNFLGESTHINVYDLISEETLTEHRSFAKNYLVPKCREIQSELSNTQAIVFLKKLKTQPLSQLIYAFTGVSYE